MACRDCARAAVVISAHEAYSPCAATPIDRKIWRARGATTLRWTGASFETAYAHPPGYDRPWARDVVDALSAPAQDAKPRTDDLEAGD